MDSAVAMNGSMSESIAFSTVTFLGGFKSNTISLYLTDIGHHHLGVGLLFVWASHLYISIQDLFNTQVINQTVA